MEILESIYNTIKDGLPMAIVFVGFLIIILIYRFIHNRQFSGANKRSVRRQLVTLLLSFVGLLILIVSSPISESSQGQLLSLIGILLSAAIALSSTTFVGNAMAGLMLRIVRSFRGGDFIKVGDHFGRVTERGLFHIEIQTEDSDLMALPNLYLVTNPVKVVRSKETIVSADISLGYNIPHRKIESLLIDAAIDTELEQPFVYIMNLGDFSVTYRISGLLKNVSHILTTRSKLRKKILDRMHQANIEIVSPTFMNTRTVADHKKFIPQEKKGIVLEKPSHPVPEEVVFKKAEEAESLEKLRDRYEKLSEELKEAKGSSGLKNNIQRIESQLGWLEELIAKKENEEKNS